jgi:hypothetical protein
VVLPRAVCWAREPQGPRHVCHRQGHRDHRARGRSGGGRGAGRSLTRRQAPRAAVETARGDRRRQWGRP